MDQVHNFKQKAISNETNNQEPKYLLRHKEEWQSQRHPEHEV